MAKKNGVKKMTIVRSTFVINKIRQLLDVIYGVTADGQALEMLKKVNSL